MIASQEVLFPRDGLQVSGIYAMPHAAQVVEFFTLGNISHKSRVGKPVRPDYSLVSPADAHRRVAASIASAGPQPAAAHVINGNVSPEPFNRCGAFAKCHNGIPCESSSLLKSVSAASAASAHGSSSAKCVRAS
jgi:hypothetical protein